MHQNFMKDLHFDRLSFLKKKGFEPAIIYDIGAHRGFWSAKIKEVFPKSQFFLFEANENNRVFLRAQSFPYFFALLGDADKTATFYANGSTGDSVFCEQTAYYQGTRCNEKQLQMTTLASVVEKNNIAWPNLVKIDVQGAEKLIIQGSPQIITHAEVVILETKILEYNKKAPLIHELMEQMANLGYSMLDILECHYLPTGELNEMDVLFAKNDSKLIKKGMLI
ncbi:MAG: FkbM family methyltransferase [Chlamydiota bacterium]